MDIEKRLTSVEVKIDNIISNDLGEIKTKLDQIDKRLWITTLFMAILSFVAGANVVTQLLGMVR